MAVKKGTAFTVVECALTILYIITLAGDSTPNKSLVVSNGPVIIDAMRWIGISFMGLNVLDNGVKGKYYQSALDKGAGGEA